MHADVPGPATKTMHGVARVLAAAGLGVDAYIHAHLADQYDAVTASISQGTLFRIEAAMAALAALLVLVWRRLPSDAYAWLVAVGGLALLLIYQYINVGTLGPVPNMYEPVWFTDKKITVLAQAVAIVTTSYLLFAGTRRAIRSHPAI
jgi:peptidoglycan/LPS O-acetylase OafA/YrhL